MDNLKLVSLENLYWATFKDVKEELIDKTEKEISEITKEKLFVFFNSFKCKKNEDIETFIHYKCIDFNLKNYARTYFILNSQNEIVAYYTLAFKALVLNDNHRLSSKMRSLINFKRYKATEEEVRIANGILIAQLGRSDNFSKEYISLEEIMTYTISTIKKIRELIGTSIILIEVEKEEKLIKRYTEIGFVKIGEEKQLTQLMRFDLER